MRRRSLAVLLAALSAACSSVHDDLSREILTSPQGWLCEPGDFGIAAEPVAIDVSGGARLAGFWLPNANARGRTVVLLHAEDTNVSAVHPWYTFLHAAGFQVLAVDPRGYGRSTGTASLRAWIRDYTSLREWLEARQDVDQTRIALYGTGMGSVAAMWAARMHTDTAAIVFEDLPSLRDRLATAVQDPDTALGAYTVGMLEFAGLPENIEPTDNAPLAKAKALFLATAEEPEGDRRALLRAFSAYAGPKDLWVVPYTGRPPHAMLTHDGAYQRRIVTFLEAALGDAPIGMTASAQKLRAASDGEAWYEIQVSTAGNSHPEPWAVEACAVLADGTPRYTRAWIDGQSGKTRIKLPQDPAWVSASRVFDAVKDDEAVFRSESTHFARSGAAVAALWPRIDVVRNGKGSPTECRELAAALPDAAAKEAFHAALEAELADVFAQIGLALAADPAAAKPWLERAVAAVPAHPERHFWPGPVATYGFSYDRLDVLDAAKKKLAALAKG